MSLPPVDKWCHHTGFEKKCLKLVTSGKCRRWRALPMENPMTGKPLDDMHGCVDDLVLFLQGQAAMKANDAFGAIVHFREMATNPEFRRKELAKANELKTIEAKDADNHHRQ